MPGQDPVQIHFRQRGAAILCLHPRHDWHAFEQRLRFFAAMRFDNTDNDLTAFGLFFARSLQHGIGFPDTGRHPEKTLQFAARRLRLFALQLAEKRVAIGPSSVALSSTSPTLTLR